MPENSPYRGILFDLERNIPEPAEEIPPYVSRAGALEEADPDTAFIVLRSAAEDRLTKSLEEIRRSRTLFCVPVLLMSPASAAGSALADGPFTGWSEAARRGAETSELLGTLPTPARDLDQDERLLTYLYCRPEQVLEPLPAYASPLLYRYPLVEAFNTAFPGREHVWLESLLNRGLLEIDSLIDRVRVCPPCREAHLNYVDGPHPRPSEAPWGRRDLPQMPRGASAYRLRLRSRPGESPLQRLRPHDRRAADRGPLHELRPQSFA